MTESVNMAIMVISTFMSVLSFITSIALAVYIIAKEKSTHTIEFRDPFKQYPDELSFEDKGGTTHLYEEYDPDMQGEETINEMNKFIKDNEVII